MSRRPLPHDPDALLDYVVDWEPWLRDGETVNNMQWIADESGSITVVEGATYPGYDTNVHGQVTIVRVAGGVDGETSTVRADATTRSGEVYTAYFDVAVAIP